MRILVAGGAGYIGSVLVPLLGEHGYDVEVADLLWFGNHLPKGVSIAAKDLFSLKETDLSQYEQVIFLAGISNDPMAEFDPAMNFVQNGALPSYLAFCAKKVLEIDELDKAVPVRPEDCVACGLCEIRCPDLAIEVIAEEESEGKAI